MLKQVALTGIIMIGAASNASAFDARGNSNNINKLPEHTVNFGERITIIDIQLNEKTSFKLGGDVRMNYDSVTDNDSENEGVIMARYKFRF